jgi:hypothetical protein
MHKILPMSPFWINDPKGNELMLVEERVDGLPFLWLHHLEDDPIEIRIKRAICGDCKGTGRIVNPAIEGDGFTASEWQEACYNDDDFAHNYWNGNYDVSCPECDRGIVIEISDKDPYVDMIEEQIADYRREEAAERSMRARGIQF